MPNFIYVAGGLLLAALLVIAAQFLHIHALDSDLIALRDENSRLTTANEAFAASAQRQDAAIKQLNTEAEARAKLAAIAIGKAKKQADAYRKSALSIQNYKLTGDKCKDIGSLVKLYYAGGRQ